jgi:hypothetical protein
MEITVREFREVCKNPIAILSVIEEDGYEWNAVAYPRGYSTGCSDEFLSYEAAEDCYVAEVCVLKDGKTIGLTVER